MLKTQRCRTTEKQTVTPHKGKQAHSKAETTSWLYKNTIQRGADLMVNISVQTEIRKMANGDTVYQF